MIAYLLKLSVEDNNNRYYKMIQDGNIFNVEYGRVGATPMKSKKPMGVWKETYDKHIADGYVDRTKYLSCETKCELQYKPIADTDVADMIDFLLRSANKELKMNYSVSYVDVSEKMIEEAQDIIYKMSENPTVENINTLLPKLFVIIPRKMKNIRDCTIQSKEEIPSVLQREQNLLDVMAAKVFYSGKVTNYEKDKTILEDNDLDISLITSEKKINQIKGFMGNNGKQFVRAFRVHNKNTDKSFERYMKKNNLSKNDIHYLYHGSKNMNYWNIMVQGQKLNPKAPITGKMFGHGLYYANKAEKSIKYTSLKGSYYAHGTSDIGYLAVFKVVYKNPLDVSVHDSWMCNIRTKDDIRGHDALFAHAGSSLLNDEIIVYDENQVTLQYLIEIKS